MTHPWLHTLLGLSLIGSLAVASGCASSPDIPEKSEAKSYQSADDSNGENASASSKKEGLPTTGAPGRGSNSAKGSGDLPKATGPIAHVDGDPIPAERFNKEIEKVARTKKYPARLINQFKSRLIDRLIDRELIDRAIEESSVKISDKEVEQKLEQVRDRIKKRARAAGQKAQSLEKLTSKFGISSEDLKESIRFSLGLEKLLVQNGLELPNDEDVRTFYEENKSKFEQPERMRVRHILTRVKPDAGDETWKKAKEEIEKLRKQAVDGSDFAKLARNNSDGPRSSNGGDLGFASRAQIKKMDPNFAKAAFSLKKSDISKPVKTRYGWHIIKAVDRKPSEVVPFEKVEDQLREKLKSRRMKKMRKSYVEKLRSDAEIEKHPDNIE